MRRLWSTSSSTRGVHDQGRKQESFSTGMPLPIIADTPKVASIPLVQRYEEIPQTLWNEMVVVFEHQRSQHQAAFITQEQDFLRPDRERALRHRQLLENATLRSQASSLEMERKWASAMIDLNGRADQGLRLYSVRLGQLASEFASLVERTLQECVKMAHQEFQHRTTMVEAVLLEAEARADSARLVPILDASFDSDSDIASTHSYHTQVSVLHMGPANDIRGRGPVPATMLHRDAVRELNQLVSEGSDQVFTETFHEPTAGSQNLLAIDPTQVSSGLQLDFFTKTVDKDKQSRDQSFSATQRVMNTQRTTWSSAVTYHQSVVETILAKTLYDLGTRGTLAPRWHLAERSAQDLATCNINILIKSLSTVLADATTKLEQPITVDIAGISDSSDACEARVPLPRLRRQASDLGPDLDFERLVRDRRRLASHDGDGLFIPSHTFTPQVLWQQPRFNHPLPVPPSATLPSPPNRDIMWRDRFESDQQEREKVFETCQLARLSQHSHAEGQRAHDFELDYLQWSSVFAQVQYDHERKFLQLLAVEQRRLNEALCLSDDNREEELRRARQTMGGVVAEERATFERKLNELVSGLKLRFEKARVFIREDGPANAGRRRTIRRRF